MRSCDVAIPDDESHYSLKLCTSVDAYVSTRAIALSLLAQVSLIWICNKKQPISHGIHSSIIRDSQADGLVHNNKLLSFIKIQGFGKPSP